MTFRSRACLALLNRKRVATNAVMGHLLIRIRIKYRRTLRLENAYFYFEVLFQSSPILLLIPLKRSLKQLLKRVYLCKPFA